MGVVADSSVLIAGERGRLDISAFAREVPDEELAIAGAGVNVGAHDLIIAATALAIGDAVWTCDARSFPRIPGLTLRLLAQSPRMRSPTRR